MTRALLAILVAFTLTFVPFRAQAAEPKFILYSVTSLGDTGILYLREGEEFRPLNIVGHETDFTISRGDCRLVLSTFADKGHGAYMRIRDLVEAKPDVIQTAELYFQNKGIERFMYPSFGPNDRSYAVIAQDASMKHLYVSNGGNTAQLIYSWSDRHLVGAIKWRNAMNVTVTVVGPRLDEIEYWEFDLEEGPDESGYYQPHWIVKHVYESFVPSEEEWWEPTMTPSIAKALECTPFKG